MPGGSSEAASYAAATDNLRTAARWLLTAAAAAGAALVAGVQLTSIGSLGTGNVPRLAAAAAGLAAALAAVGYMIFEISMMLTDEWITLAQLELEPFRQQLLDSGKRRDRRRAEAIGRIYNEIQLYQDEFYGSVADSLTDLYRRLIKANREARQSSSEEFARTAEKIRTTVDTVVSAANYSRARTEFAALRRRLAWSGAVFIVGIVVFVYAANPPKPAAASPAAAHQGTTAGATPAARPSRGR